MDGSSTRSRSLWRDKLISTTSQFSSESSLRRCMRRSIQYTRGHCISTQITYVEGSSPCSTIPRWMNDPSEKDSHDFDKTNKPRWKRKLSGNSLSSQHRRNKKRQTISPFRFASRTPSQNLVCNLTKHSRITEKYPSPLTRLSKSRFHHNSADSLNNSSSSIYISLLCSFIFFLQIILPFK